MYRGNGDVFRADSAETDPHFLPCATQLDSINLVEIRVIEVTAVFFR
jgi:hypothetical protein